MVLSDGSEDVVEEGEEGEEEEDGGGEGSGGLVVCSGHETVDLLKPVHQEMHGMTSSSFSFSPAPSFSSVRMLLIRKVH